MGAACRAMCGGGTPVTPTPSQALSRQRAAARPETQRRRDVAVPRERGRPCRREEEQETQEGEEAQGEEAGEGEGRGPGPEQGPGPGCPGPGCPGAREGRAWFLEQQGCEQEMRAPETVIVSSLSPGPTLGGLGGPPWGLSCCLSQRQVSLWFQGEDLDFWLSTTPLPATVRARWATCVGLSGPAAAHVAPRPQPSRAASLKHPGVPLWVLPTPALLPIPRGG